MRRQFILATTATLGCAIALTGCGSKSNSSTKVSTAVQTATSMSTPTATNTATDTSMASPTATDTSTATGWTSPSGMDSSEASASGSAAGGHTCSSKQVSATINGRHKCLEAGQECSAKAVNDYSQYGFVCEQKDNRWVLRRNS